MLFRSNKGVSNEELLGKERADEISKILSEHAKSRTGEKNSFYGRSHSDETKNKMSKIRKEQGYKGSQNKPISINGKEYTSLGEASKDLEIPITTIRWRCKSENPKYEDWVYI